MRHERSWIFKMFPFFFGFTFFVILVYWGMLAFVGIKTVSVIESECKDGLAKCAGRAVKQFNDGMEGK